MKKIKHIFLLMIGIYLCTSLTVVYGQEKTRIFVVSSYHPEYLWSQDTNKGVCAALIDFGYLDNKVQAEEYTKNDYVESSKAVVKKTWMDTKRKSSRSEMAEATERVIKEINIFKPDIILLGDDNATNYIGNQYIDTDIPIVFWGVNGLPVKYGLLDTVEKPGHNVTGIYQAGYLLECVEYLKKLVPSIKTIAVLSDDSETGRSKLKELEKLEMEGKLPVKITDTVATNSLSEWKSAAQRFQKEADAIFVVNHNTIKDEKGNPVDQMEIGAWYLSNIKKPDCAHEKQFAEEGMLLVVDDSGYKQGYEAVKIANEILKKGEDPALIPARAPEERGPVIVNRQRAKTLDIDLSDKDFIEEYINSSLALEKYPEAVLLPTELSVPEKDISKKMEEILKQKSVILNKELAKNPIIIKAVREANAKNNGISLEAILELDKKWQSKEGTNEFAKEFLTNKCAESLLGFQDKFFDEYREIFIADERGLLVGTTNKTTDYYQADEDWWIKGYNEGKGQIHYGAIAYDTSAMTEAVFVYVPIIDPDTNKAIGVMKVVVDIKAIGDEL